jgi:hypothetical protein
MPARTPQRASHARKDAPKGIPCSLDRPFRDRGHNVFLVTYPPIDDVNTKEFALSEDSTSASG